MTYEEFIQDILDTRGRFNCGDEYHERHHIVPRCIGGGNDEDNLIDLFAREHFEAHRLLALENPDNNKLVYAYGMMAWIRDKDKCQYEVSSEEYEEAKKAFSKSISGINSPSYGIRGENHPSYGKHPSEDTIEKMRNAAKERCQNPEYRQRMKDNAKERFSIPENNPMYGKHHAEDTKQKISNANRGRIWSQEDIDKRRVGQIKKWQDQAFKEQHSKIMQEIRSRPEYKQKQREAHRGAKSGRALAVINIDTKKIYGASILASEELNIHNSSILKCCKGKIKTAGGYDWKYVYDYTLKDGTIIPGAITLGLITTEMANEQLNNKI